MGKISKAIEKMDKKSALYKKAHSKETKTPKEKNNVVHLNNDLLKGADRQLDPRLVAYHQPESIESEAFKVLRTNILFPKKGNPPKSILVTSTSPGEGKSFVSANLAVSIARGVEDYVLLVDGDMRKPSIQERFGNKNSAGLCEYLSKGVALNSIILKTPINKLSILGVGSPPQNPTELLSSKKMSDLLLEIRNRYDDRYIIIDTPPPVVAPETIAMSKHVDGIILVVKERGVDRKLVKDTIEMLQSDKLLGVVFNWSQRKIKKYYGYYRQSAK